MLYNSYFYYSTDITTCKGKIAYIFVENYYFALREVTIYPSCIFLCIMVKYQNNPVIVIGGV